MKSVHIVAIFLFLAASIYFIIKPLIPTVKQTITDVQPVVSPKPAMKLTSPVFENYQKIPVDYTCDGKKFRPPFSIEGVPKQAKSLAIIIDDPDAPMGTFTHWLIWNISPEITRIDEGVAPTMSQEGTTSTGKQVYVPPCPSSGQHRYFFTLYALDTKLGLDGKAQKKDVELAMQGHVIEESLLIGVYRKQ